MKKRILIAAAVAVLAVLVALQIPAVKAETSWKSAARADTLEGYDLYVTAYPESGHADEAERRHDDLMWANAGETDEQDASFAYLKRHPNGLHVDEAKGRIDELDWADALARDTEAGYGDYAENHPDGAHIDEVAGRSDAACWLVAVSTRRVADVDDYLANYGAGAHAAEAQQLRLALLNDDAPFIAARDAGTVEAINEFLQEYPGHVRTAEASTIAADITGRDIFELMAEGKIEVGVLGAGIETITLQLRRTTSYPLTVRIPASTYFASGSSGVQNMIAIETLEIELDTADWQENSQSVTCTNMRRNVPTESNGFSVWRNDNGELQALIAAIEASGDEWPGYTVAQAATWIITDNADYDALGILVGTWGDGTQTREIGPDEAAAAMRLLQTAGIDVRGKAIWGDRGAVLEGIEDADLRDWLAAQG